MKVTEAEQISAKQFEESINGNLAMTSAVRKQYLESARGHYLSALAGLNAGKLEQTQICDSAGLYPELEDNALEQATVAEPTSIEGKLGQEKPFAEMDIQIHLPKGVLKASDKKSHSMKVQFNRTLAKNNKEQIAEMISRIGAFGQEMENVDASELEASRDVLSELGGAKESILKGVVEGSSLQKMVMSLKAELQSLKKEHAELQDKDTGAVFASRDLPNKLLQSKSENEGRLINEPKVGPNFEGNRNQHEVEDLKSRDKGVKREHEVSKLSAEMMKRPRVALYDEAKEATMSALDQNKSLVGKRYDTYVSTSESSARIMISEDELESSSHKVDKSDELERDKLTAVTGQVDSDKYDHASEFSIRDYVFAVRNKDISMNWPFSQKNLHLCLKHGVKNVLPPFRPDSLRDSSMKRCLTETSLNSEESNLDERPLVLKDHLVPEITMDHRWTQELAEGYRDSDLLPFVEEKDLAFKSIATANSQSEVGSVSTSNLPLSEVSDEREAAASAANKKTKSSASQLSDKKSRMTVKMRISGYRSSADDITSACTAPPEAMASKICPVCETFSSSSNTTLNAHIDQCLSSQSTPNWKKNSRLIKPRIKPRKIRLMADIYTTALHCTLEDLDRRNGTNWATNAEVPSQDTTMIAQGKNCRVSSRSAVNNGGDGAVYIDSNGTKIRILSKFDDFSSSPKSREVLRPKKQSRKDKTSNFFSPNRKRRLAKRLKYLKESRQRKRFSSRKVNGRPNNACGAEEPTSTGGEKYVETEQAVPFVNAQQQKNASGSGSSRQWISSMRSNLSKKKDSEDINKPCRYKVQATQDLQPGSDQLDSGEMHVKKKHLSSPKKSLFPSVRKPKLYRAATNQKGEGSCGRNTCSPSVRGAIRGYRESSLVPLKLGAARFKGEDTMEGEPKPMDPTATPTSSIEREFEAQTDAVKNTESASPCSGKLSDSPYGCSFEGVGSHCTETNMLSHSLPCVRACQSNSKQTSSPVEKSRGCRRDEKGDLWSAGISRQSGTMPDHFDRSEIINSPGHGSLMKVRRMPGWERSEDGSRDTKRSGGLLDERQDNYCCVRSTLTGNHSNRDVIAPVASSSFALGETVTSLSRSSDPELRRVSNEPHPQPKTLQYSDKFQGPLFRTEARVHPSQRSLIDDHEIFYGSVVGTERLDVETVDSDFDARRGSSFPEVDPIPIPGPPGSDLPSFSDMGSEDLHRSSSLSSLAQTSEDGDDAVDRDSSDSPLSATSTVSNVGLTDDPIVSEPECSTVTLPVSSSAYPGWFVASSGPMVGTSKIFLESATVTESATSVVECSKESVIAHSRGPLIVNSDNQQCCCSQKEGVPWSAALHFEESQFPGQKMETVIASHAGKHTGSTFNRRPNCLDSRNEVLYFGNCSRGESENLTYPIETSYESIMPIGITTEAAVSFPRSGNCDSASPAPILRLMGKDLMVINNEKADLSRGQAVQNVCTNRHVVSEFSPGVPRSWQHQSPQSAGFIGPLFHEQDPRTFSVPHFDFDVGSSNVINNFTSPKQASGGVYINKHIHSKFSVLGAAPLQR